MDLLYPKPLPVGATIGIFCSSSPAHVWAKDVYHHALNTLSELGFKILEGKLCKAGAAQGYRSGYPEERAEEFMELIESPDVDCLMACIGGFNSSSIIPLLDFSKIRQARKIICGYSDITSLHMAILHYSRLSTFYGPAVVPSFGEYPKVLSFTLESFLDAAMRHKEGERLLQPPAQWSNHRRDWTDGTWKKGHRIFQENAGWKVLFEGASTAPIIVCNLNTLTSIAGTDYFPRLDGKILLLEEELAPLSQEERRLRHLEQLGVFKNLAGLIIGKPECLKSEGALFSLEDLLLEILPKNPSYPVVTNFDCGHTHPMITLAQESIVQIDAFHKQGVRMCVKRPMFM